jgi:hypothetical protein
MPLRGTRNDENAYDSLHGSGRLRHIRFECHVPQPTPFATLRPALHVRRLGAVVDILTIPAGLFSRQRTEYRPQSRLRGPLIESSLTDGLFLFQ